MRDSGASVQSVEGIQPFAFIKLGVKNQCQKN